MNRSELLAILAGWEEPAYRVDQLLEWLYRHGAVTWDAMKNLPQRLRDELAGRFALTTATLVRCQGSPDATQKFLWRLEDGALIESVLIPASPALYGEPSDRHTLCVSTQVGCAYGCRFCASGLRGWQRHLEVHEIVNQVLGVERWLRDAPLEETSHEVGARDRAVNNLVIMGMGEPLANFDNLIKALEILNASWGAGIGARKITVSTSGLAPQIRALAAVPQQYGLAISLHGATDAVRSRLMPVNRKYPLAALVAAGEYYLQRKGRMITLEYVLIAGVNDAFDQVPSLAQIARRLQAKVNLIPYNPVPGLAWQRPPRERQESFLRALADRRVKVTLRREKGRDIDAACGQLRLRTLEEVEGTPPFTFGPTRAH